jgi:Fe-Mn family superoxide dismutase
MNIKTFEFPELPYEYGALEPYIDAQTMELHYTKHHNGYFNKFTNAVKGTELENEDFETILGKASTLAPVARNNGGGHYNHSLFWTIMSGDGGGQPEGVLAEAIDTVFGSFDAFKEQFATAAAGRFGSGWAWLIVNENNELEICSTPNQDNPLMDTTDCIGKPVMGLDVWEHAYYLKYNNRRPDYIDAFWNVVNWKQVEKNYEELIA